MTYHNPIYAPWNSGLGDQLKTISLLLHQAALTNTRVTRLHSPDGHLSRMHREILNVLDYEHGIELTPDPPTEQLSGYNVWACPPWPTKERWTANAPHHYACYHFKGVSSAADKNPPAEDRDILLSWLEKSGFVAMELGSNMSIAECVTLAKHSAFFVGVDSGFAHLCASVGVPRFLLQYRLPIVTAHRGSAYIQCDGTEDFLRHKFPTWVDMLRFCDHPDGWRSRVAEGRKEREAQSGLWWLP